MLPVEQDENSLYLRVQEICNLLANSAEHSVDPDGYVFSLSSHKLESSEEAIRAAIIHSRLGATRPIRLNWITRGEACWWAGGASGDTVIVKGGTVGFAHAFQSSYPSDPKSWRAGGWGLLSGDDGGAYSIGRRMLYRLFEEQDGRRRNGAFSERFARLMGEDDTFGIVRWIRHHKDTYSLRLGVARLAQTAVFLAEQEADWFCTNLLRAAAHKLASCFAAVCRSARAYEPAYGTNELSVFVQGRLLQSSPLYSRFLCIAIQRQCAVLRIPLRLHALRQGAVLGCLQNALANDRWSRTDAYAVAHGLATTIPGLTAEFSSEVDRTLLEVCNAKP